MRSFQGAQAASLLALSVCAFLQLVRLTQPIVTGRCPATLFAVELGVFEQLSVVVWMILHKTNVLQKAQMILMAWMRHFNFCHFRLPPEFGFQEPRRRAQNITYIRLSLSL
jgi:hypothetical protein